MSRRCPAKPWCLQALTEEAERDRAGRSRIHAALLRRKPSNSNTVNGPLSPRCPSTSQTTYLLLIQPRLESRFSNSQAQSPTLSSSGKKQSPNCLMHVSLERFAGFSVLVFSAVWMSRWKKGGESDSFVTLQTSHPSLSMKESRACTGLTKGHRNILNSRNAESGTVQLQTWGPSLLPLLPVYQGNAAV